MKKKSLQFFYFFCLIFQVAFSNQNYIQDDDPSIQEPLPRILLLIVANDDLPEYIEFQKIWRAYMHIDPLHVESYFLKMEPDLPSVCEIHADTIFCKVERNYIPGIINKNILSMEKMLPRLNEFDYIFRTNLSSFIYFPKLLEFLKTLPRKNCYCGVPVYVEFPFASGAGFILSTDLVEKMVLNKNRLYNITFNHEDVVIGRFFYEEHVPLITTSRMDVTRLDYWLSNKNNIPEHIYHFRTKNEENLRLTDEVFIQKELLKMYYNITDL